MTLPPAVVTTLRDAVRRTITFEGGPDTSQKLYRLKERTAVLIPRPETEGLVEAVLGVLREELARWPRPRVLDLGTGSGAIALAVADDKLVGRLVVHPAKLAGALEHEAAFRLLRQPSAAVVHLPVHLVERELAADRFEVRDPVAGDVVQDPPPAGTARVDLDSQFALRDDLDGVADEADSCPDTYGAPPTGCPPQAPPPVVEPPSHSRSAFAAALSESTSISRRRTSSSVPGAGRSSRRRITSIAIAAPQAAAVQVGALVLEATQQIVDQQALAHEEGLAQQALDRLAAASAVRSCAAAEADVEEARIDAFQLEVQHGRAEVAVRGSVAGHTMDHGNGMRRAFTARRRIRTIVAV